MLNDSLFISLSQFVATPSIAFWVSSYEEKQSKILHIYIYQRHTPDTKKSDICR